MHGEVERVDVPREKIQAQKKKKNKKKENAAWVLVGHSVP